VQVDKRARKSAQRSIVRRWRRTAGSVIATTIRDSGKSLAEVAEVLGVSEDTMSAIVRGIRKLEIGEIVLIAKAVNIDPLVLVRRIFHW
jgi:plasmid maintenance system antidote protein VapI